MARFGFVGGSYTSQSVNADCQQCMNWYPETLESGQSKSAMALYPTPGLVAFFAAPDPGPVRGIYTINARTFLVSANNVYEVGVLGTAIHTYAASVTNDAQPVSFAGGATQLLLASGGNAYVIDLVANTLTLIPPATLTNVSMVAYIDGFFFALIKNSNQIFASNLLDATTWPPLATTKVSVFTDNVTSIFADHRELAVLGPRAAQVYFDSGNFPFPLDVIPGAFVEQGIVAQFSIVKLDNSVFWLGADERGSGIAWRAQGYNPVRVSNHAVEFAWQGYARIDDAVAYSYQDQGHSFYVLNFPTAQKTWVYDVATGMWHERGFWNTQAGVFNQHRAQFHTFNFGKHLVGGSANGTLYQMSIALKDDFGNVIRRVRKAPHISVEQEWTFHHQLQVDFESGLGPEPPLLDGGTYSATQIHVTPSGVTTDIYLFDAGVSTNLVNYLVNVLVQNNGTHQIFIDPGLVGVAQAIPAGATMQVSIPCVGTGFDHIFLKFRVNVLGDALDVLVYNPVIFNQTTNTNLIPLGNRNFTGWTVAFGSVATLTQNQVTPGSTPRDPLAMLSWSDDGGHSWSNEYQAGAGKAGEYKKRVIWRRLGRSRDRVYQIAVTDAIPWRIVDAYLLASPGFAPQERLSRQMAKVS
jgi:hypothetical protein